MGRQDLSQREGDPCSLSTFIMEAQTGIGAAEEILSMGRHAIIIFLTGSDEHMPEAFSCMLGNYGYPFRFLVSAMGFILHAQVLQI